MSAALLIEDGWTQWLYRDPPFGVLIQIFREGWKKPTITKREDIHPEADVCGLYWRLTGIGREYLDNLPPGIAQQSGNDVFDQCGFLSSLFGSMGAMGAYTHDAGSIVESR